MLLELLAAARPETALLQPAPSHHHEMVSKALPAPTSFSQPIPIPAAQRRLSGDPAYFQLGAPHGWGITRGALQPASLTAESHTLLTSNGADQREQELIW